MFEVVIQLGAILAVVLIYFKNLIPWGFNKTKEDTKNTINLWVKILIGCVPCAIIGLLFDDYINAKFYNPWTVAIMLIIYGILFIVIENSNKNKKAKVNDIQKLSIKDAFLVGLFQVLSIIPGTSRSGAFQ
jgi:undecaprenyl-diphosphatase